MRDTATLGMEALWGAVARSPELPPFTPVQACAPVAAQRVTTAGAAPVGAQSLSAESPLTPVQRRAQTRAPVAAQHPPAAAALSAPPALTPTALKAARKRFGKANPQLPSARAIAKALVQRDTKPDNVSPAADLITGKRARKPKRIKLAPSLTPHACSILAVDPGENSGWALQSYGELIDFDECDAFGDGPEHAIERLLCQPGPWVLVVERPFRVKHQTQTGIGTADTIWRKRGERLGFGKRVARRIVRVYPSSWRAIALGKGWGNAEREKARAEEQRLAAELVLTTELRHELGDDAAPAVLIACKWAAYAGEVLAKLPKVKPPKPPKEPKAKKLRAPRDRRAA